VNSLARLDVGVACRALHQGAEALGDRPRATRRSSTSRSSDCSDCRYASRPQPEQALPIPPDGHAAIRHRKGRRFESKLRLYHRRLTLTAALAACFMPAGDLEDGRHCYR
jgi:hypothetical protein